ncbi:GIY-YIG nuclease family protein [Crenobacter cavernae]|uniref:GIY-YIG nuclease family protein n=1 Tax=Crenobacter cavernae TaxID=2290923 RepID=A0A345Y3K8_9NEIS|nr:GIY-YIG nuclease family protein [Crenobacter cavernae]AXK38510.1 GIY-YIG nuclease family protein [Crenobacter cavernae]
MHSAKFEIDIISALSSQLEAAFDKLIPGPLTPEILDTLEAGQGIYQLYQTNLLVYVGKADNLPKRLREHHLKLRGRCDINVGDMSFKCLYVHENWTTLAPETAMIRHYKTKGTGECEWNGNGFGPHDPGRNRELTNKAPDGFDMRYPIKKDWPCAWVVPGTWNALDLLVALKNSEKLPYLIRYETEKLSSDKYADYRKGHPDHRVATVAVPDANMPVVELVRLITQALPGWQSTAFPSHMILYKESRGYRHGTIIHREP